MLKICFLCFTGVLFGVAEFFILNILPNKSSKTIWIILCFVLFVASLLLGAFAIYELGVYWNLKQQTKIILRVCLGLVVLSSIIYSNIQK